MAQKKNNEIRRHITEKLCRMSPIKLSNISHFHFIKEYLKKMQWHYLLLFKFAIVLSANQIKLSTVPISSNWTRTRERKWNAECERHGLIVGTSSKLPDENRHILSACISDNQMNGGTVLWDTWKVSYFTVFWVVIVFVLRVDFRIVCRIFGSLWPWIRIRFFFSFTMQVHFENSVICLVYCMNMRVFVTLLISLILTKDQPMQQHKITLTHKQQKIQSYECGAGVDIRWLEIVHDVVKLKLAENYELFDRISWPNEKLASNSTKKM